jgi:hypothetical protein
MEELSSVLFSVMRFIIPSGLGMSLGYQKGAGLPGCSLHPLPREIKKYVFRHNDNKVLCDTRLSQNRSLKSSGDWYIDILKNQIRTSEYVEFFLFSFNFPCNLT